MSKLLFFSTMLVLLENLHAEMTIGSSEDASNHVVTILSISTVPGQANSVPKGSVMGGSILYLKVDTSNMDQVQGLDEHIHNNKVFIGHYPCLTSDWGQDRLSISCITIKANPHDPNLSNLQIVVRVAGKRDSICTFSDTYCFFTYLQVQRSELQFVSPRSNYPNRLSFWKAKWGIENTQNLKRQMIGLHGCDRVNMPLKNIDQESDIIECRISKDIEAGYYAYSLVTTIGLSEKNLRLSEKKVFSNEIYDSKIIPIITKLNTNYGSRKGQILTIYGYGFSQNQAENVVQITNQNQEYGDSIEILLSTPTQIKVKLPEITEQKKLDSQIDNKLFIQGSGLFYTKYDLQGQSQYYENCEEFRKVLLENPSQLNNFIITDGIYPEPEIFLNSNQQYFGEYFRGFLKAPQTGNYKFYLASQDQALFYIQTSSPMDDSSSDEIAANNTCNPFRNYWYQQILNPQTNNPTISNNIQLTGNEYYFIELFRIGKQENQYLTLSMEIENNSGQRQSNSIKSIWAITTSSSPISGTFQLELSIDGIIHKFQVNDDCFDLPFDFSSELMANNFERVTGSRPIVQTYGKAIDGWTWVIQFQTHLGKQIDINLITTNLIGQIETINCIQENDNLLFEPIPNEILFTYSEKPQVSVKTKGILAGCQTKSACDFTISDTRTLTLMDYQVDQLTLAVTLISGVDKPILKAKDLVITFLNAECYNIQFSTSASPYKVSCDLELYNFTIYKEAGFNQVPIIYDKNIGYSFTNENLNGTDVDLVITSVSPSSGSPYGGTLVTLKGTGFPKNNNSNLIIELPTLAHIISVSPNQIQFITLPGMEQGKMRIILNNKQAEINFNSTDQITMQITRLQINNISPLYNDIFRVTGTNFGTYQDDLTIIFASKNLSYKFRVVDIIPNPQRNLAELVSYIFDIQIGVYNVTVHRANIGNSFALPGVAVVNCTLFFQKVEFADYNTPAKSSIMGGKKVFVHTEVEGYFSSVKLFVANQLAPQLLLSKFIYQFKTPPKDPKLPDGKYEVKLIYPGKQYAFCYFEFEMFDICKIEYDTALTPKIQNYPENCIQYFSSDQTICKKNYIAGDTEVLTGTDLGSTLSIQFGTDENTLTVPVTANKFSFIIPNLNPGEYFTQIYNENGNADKSWYTIIQEKQLKILSIAPLQPSPGGEFSLNITGEGLPREKSIYTIYAGSTRLTGCSEYYERLYGLELQGDEVSSPGFVLYCPFSRQTEQTIAVTITSFPLADNSAIKRVASFNITMASVDQMPLAYSITINDADTYDINIKSQKVQKNDFILKMKGDRLDSINPSLKSEGLVLLGYIMDRNQTDLIAAFSQVPEGNYRINYFSINGPLVYIEDDTRLNLLVQFDLSSPSTPSQVQFIGGLANISTSIRVFQQIYNFKVKACDRNCRIIQIIDINYGKISTMCMAPQILTSQLFSKIPAFQQKYRVITSSEIITSADISSDADKINDNREDTYYSSQSSNCYVELSFGLNYQLQMQVLSFLPRLDLESSYLIGAKFLYTVDGIDWLPIITIESTVHNGWNHFYPSTTIPNIQTLRFIDDRVESNSKCQLAEIKFKGQIFYDNNQPLECDIVVYNEKEFSQTISKSVSYTDTAPIPIVQSVIPNMGLLIEETTIKITGTGFINQKTRVIIDGFDCLILNVTETIIHCLTTIREYNQMYAERMFMVLVNDINAIINEEFRFIVKWSDTFTWQLINGFSSNPVFLPNKDETVTIPKELTLLLDINTPQMNQIIVKGTLMFSDEQDIQFDANSILIQGGTLQIGSQAKRHQHKVVITLHGDENETEFTEFGNKVIGCEQCNINIFGKERNPIWTYLSCTVEAGQVEINLDDPVDWGIGEQIVIVTNSFDNQETETKYIIAISLDKTILTLDSPLQYRHYSAYETFQSQRLVVKTEVGLLTRNIIIQGDQKNKNYGYHMFIDGKDEKTSIQISYTEFRYGGQQGIDNRYPINFHFNGLQDESYLIGNSIHDSYARCINIQGVQFLKIQKNLCFNIVGHGIALEVGTEMNNIIENNLIINTKQTWKLQETDISVASLWITNPSNIVRNNVVVGSDWNGFYYDLKLNTYKVFSTNYICPRGMKLIEFNNNRAHSNGRAGLHIKQLSTRTNPCKQSENYDQNPSLQAVFCNYSAWFGQYGIILEGVENVLVKNIKISDLWGDSILENEINAQASSSVIQDALLIRKQYEENQQITQQFINATQKLQQINMTLLNISYFDNNFSSCTFGSVDNGSSEGSNSSDGNTSNGNSSNEETENVYKLKKYWKDPHAWGTKQVPQEGENVFIPQQSIIILNISPPKIKNLEISGILIFEESQEVIILQVESISITSSGKLIAGNPIAPFLGKLKIILTGLEENSILVSNALELYSPIPKTISTRLRYWNDPYTLIVVTECNDWKIGDQIVIGPSGSYPNQADKVTISEIDSTNCKILQGNDIKYSHFGAHKITIEKAGIGSLDMRAVVAHINRNIVISGSQKPCKVIIQNSQQLNQNGYAILHGVEFENCGQEDLLQGGLDFSNSKTNNEIIGCSFHDSLGIQLNIQNSQNINVINNIFYSGVRALVQINNSQFIKFKNNSLIYVKKRENENWAVLGNFIYINETIPTRMIRQIVDISGNVGQGSEDTGFFIMSSSCSDSKETSFYNNQCSAAVLACFAIRESNRTCDYVQGVQSYHSGVGIMYSINSAQIRLEYAMAAENNIGIVLRSGSDNIQDNVMYFSNSYVTPFARPDCDECYDFWKLRPYCIGTIGVKMGTVTTKAYPPFSQIPSDQYDDILSVQRLDLRVYISKVEFESFQYQNSRDCFRNEVFRTNWQACDMTGQHFLQNTVCSDCDFESILLNFMDQSTEERKKKEQGSINCTGQRNVLIEDQTGQFFGQVSQAILNNTDIGENMDNCVRQTFWDGYFCKNRLLTVLMFMSTAPDYNTRLFSPVFLTYGNITNTVNSFSDWSDGVDNPLRKRESKYVSLVQVQKIINLAGVGENPTDSEFWLSKKSHAGSPSDFVIIEWQFNVSQMIQVSVNNSVIQPGISTTQKHHNLSSMADKCGSNNYFFENRTIHFVINGEVGCLVKISVKNTLYITTLLLTKNGTFSVEEFLYYARSTLGGNPQNFYFLDLTKNSKRLLQEEDKQIIIKILWLIVDDAKIGTKQSEYSEQILSQFASALESFVPPAELGLVLEQSSQIVSMSKLNNSISQVSSTNTTQNENDSNNYNDIELTLNEIVNENNNNTNESALNQTENLIIATSNSSSTTMTATILVSVICPIVGVIILIIGFCYFRKLRKVRITAMNNKIGTVDTIKIDDVIDPQQQLKATQSQSVR